MFDPDIAVTSPDGRPLVDVEVKALLGRGPEWAAELRNRLMRPSPPPYFLLAMPERLFLWRNEGDSSERLPDLELQTESVLKRYFPAHWTTPEQWNSGEVLELAISAWLNDLAWGNPNLLSTPPVLELERTGFLAAIRGGCVRFGAAA